MFDHASFTRTVVVLVRANADHTDDIRAWDAEVTNGTETDR